MILLNKLIRFKDVDFFTAKNSYKKMKTKIFQRNLFFFFFFN